MCAALLEDPKGSGRQFLVSAAGDSCRLADIQQSASFFTHWRRSLTAEHGVDFPTLKHIFYVAYEAVHAFEDLPQAKTALTGDVIWRHEPHWCLCFSPAEQKVYLSSTQSEAELDMVERLLLAHTSAQPAPDCSSAEVQVSHSNYQDAVEQVKAYIRQGDVFQVNIARFWQRPYHKEALTGLYAALRLVNPAPFACFLQAGDLSIISASPERLFSISAQGRVSTRPIAGTRKRCVGEQDDVLSNELLLSEKERAEHIMLLDLERNDLGKVCVPGSIVVDECMVIEKYATVQHIASNISGQLEPKYDMLDVLQAMFPGGTITGCPKVRCMEIIHELEPQARGPYTGGVGYVAWDGTVDMNILIRTFWFWQNQLHWAAGAGIVADSVAEDEEMETEHKVAGLMRVFQ